MFWNMTPIAPIERSESGHLRVVLVAARNPLNIGAAARAMSNFGFLRLGVVNPYEVAFARRDPRSGRGAAGGRRGVQRRGRSGRRLRAGGRNHGGPSP